MTDHRRTVVYLPAAGIIPPTRVVLCSCGDRTCTEWKESTDA